MRTLPACVAAALVCAIAFPTVAHAQGVADDGYFPGDAPTNDGYLPDSGKPEPAPGGPFAAEPGPIAAGLNIGFGFQLPTPASDRSGVFGEYEFRPTLDVSLAAGLTFGGIVQWDVFGLRIGVGGLNRGLYEDVFGFREMRANHFWLGTHLRVTPLPNAPLRPFVSASLGGDRLVAAHMEGTGTFRCEDVGGGFYDCEEETRRAFSVGYWGLSTGIGGGIRFAEIADSLSVIVEVQGVRNRYGRVTNSAFPNRSTGDDPPTLWNVSTLLLLQVGG